MEEYVQDARARARRAGRSSCGRGSKAVRRAVARTVAAGRARGRVMADHALAPAPATPTPATPAAATPAPATPAFATPGVAGPAAARPGVAGSAVAGGAVVVEGADLAGLVGERLPGRFVLVDPVAARLERMVPGPALTAALAGLAVADATDAALVEAVAAHERLISAATAAQARALEELLARRGSGTSALARVADEVAARLGITHHAAERRTHAAGVLAQFPEVADALTTGRIDPRKAQILTQDETGLTLEDQRALATTLLDRATELTPPQLRQALRTAATTADPAAAARRHDRAHTHRAVTITDAPDAMAYLVAYIRADHAHTIRTYLDALADSAAGPAETRTRDQLRADVLTDTFTLLLTRGLDLDGRALPRRHGRHPHIQVTIPAGTLLGLGEHPAHLAGYGPIPADLARTIAADGTWRALFTDPDTGEYHHLSTRAYRPGADLTRHIIARDVTCTFPGCRQPAYRTDLDHIDPHDPTRTSDPTTADQTCQDNLHSLCRRHHNLKTTGTWTVTRDPHTATITWTSPTGHTYTRHPTRPPGPPPTGDPPY
ncbi:uncharacterized protein DUF222 [Georgenia muralis]|uniref:Uncharacterized protein DUF222 n=1 Tax=Georgenia muralis TaxID=154117 RepID=A0A3N4Z1N5_9MICO|nr:uncharacterized protein DUF222 [Georgenia muralis]